MKQWWHLTAEKTAEELACDLSAGLSTSEAKRRFEKFGPNQLAVKEGFSALKIFLGQFQGFIIWVLIAAAIVSGFLKEAVDAVVIIAIVILNAVSALSRNTVRRNLWRP